MKLNKQAVTVISILLIAVIVYFLYLGFFSSNKTEETTSSATTQKETQDTSEQDQDTEVKQNREVPMGGKYINYDKADLAFADEGNVVLFFSADWCPTCSILRADLDKKSGEIPDDLLILKVDYDTETALKEKYGVTYQHTLVQVNSNGDQIKKWTNSYSLEEILDEVQS